MPQRFELMELTTGNIGGIPFAVALARGGRMVGFAATIDGDGLMETRDDCLDAARLHLRRLDKKKTPGEDLPTGLEQSGSSGAS